MVCVRHEGAAFEEIGKVLDCEVKGSKFTIEDAVAGLCLL